MGNFEIRVHSESYFYADHFERCSYELICTIISHADPKIRIKMAFKQPFENGALSDRFDAESQLLKLTDTDNIFDFKNAVCEHQKEIINKYFDPRIARSVELMQQLGFTDTNGEGLDIILSHSPA